MVLTDPEEERAIQGMELLKEPIPVKGGFHISVSMGYATGSSYKEAFARADKALYHVKEHGKSGYLTLER